MRVQVTTVALAIPSSIALSATTTNLSIAWFIILGAVCAAAGELLSGEVA